MANRYFAPLKVWSVAKRILALTHGVKRQNGNSYEVPIMPGSVPCPPTRHPRSGYCHCRRLEESIPRTPSIFFLAARARLELSYQTRIDAVPGSFGAAAGAGATANCDFAISFREFLDPGRGEHRRQAGDTAGRYRSEQDDPQCAINWQSATSGESAGESRTRHHWERPVLASGRGNRASFFVFTTGFGDEPGRTFEELSNSL